MHIAAQNNYVECLELLCAYNADISLLNYQNQTPLGCAKMHGSIETAHYLQVIVRPATKEYLNPKIQSRFQKLTDVAIESVPLLENAVNQWDIVIDEFGHRTYVNRTTCEQRSDPPGVQSIEALQSHATTSAPYLKKTHIVVESDTITTQEYIKEVKATHREIGFMMKELSAVALIAFAFKRKVARNRRIRQQKEQKFRRIIYKFIVQNIRFMDLVRKRRNSRVTRVQALWRGYRLRREFYSSGDYQERWYKMKAMQLALMIYRLWKSYKLARVILQMTSIGSIPRTFEEWQLLIHHSNYVRRIGLIDEYRWQHVFIYQHQITKLCTFDRPSEFDRYEYISTGYTAEQQRLVIKLQALARGWQVRSYHIQQARAYQLADTALELYLKHPEVDDYHYRYTLYCHVVINDHARARGLYVESFRRMHSRGPDNALLLYSYAIFIFVNREVDFLDVEALIARAQAAELNLELKRRRQRGDFIDTTALAARMHFGLTYKPVKIGFFQRYAESHNTCMSWHLYAACLFLVDNDFEKSFAAFVCALDREALNMAARTNLDFMLNRHFGDDIEQKLKLLQKHSLRA